MDSNSLVSLHTLHNAKTLFTIVVFREIRENGLRRVFGEIRENKMCSGATFVINRNKTLKLHKIRLFSVFLSSFLRFLRRFSAAFDFVSSRSAEAAAAMVVAKKTVSFSYPLSVSHSLCASLLSTAYCGTPPLLQWTR